jgi:hypothetical protein
MRRLALYLAASVLASAWVAGQTAPAADEYHVYGGNTHSHTANTWSHGEQRATNGCAGILTYTTDAATHTGQWAQGYVQAARGGCPAIFVIDGAQFPAPGTALKPDWHAVQGSPAAHFALAKQNGYDFYAATDHSQEAVFQPQGLNGAWADAKQQAAAATDNRFVAIAGFEYSENDGPGGTGHINVFNSAEMINALAPGADLAHFYQWLETARPNGDGPVLASFNHPSAGQYGNWALRDPRVTDVITMLEVINSNNKIHEAGFIQALDHGWKVAPIAGNDNHGLSGIARQHSRTFVLATALTKSALLKAMQHRRTNASLEGNLQARYRVNGAIMGSTLDRPSSFRFAIDVSDPDDADPLDRITRIEIVKTGGAVVDSYTPAPAAAIVHWAPTVEDGSAPYFFVRVFNAGGGDAPEADTAKPVAWLAPVWTGR